MINAEVTADNRPAYCASKYMPIKVSWGTHKDQGCVEVLVVFPQEFLIMFFGHLQIVVVEFVPAFPPGGRFILIPAARWY